MAGIHAPGYIYTGIDENYELTSPAHYRRPPPVPEAALRIDRIRVASHALAKATGQC